MEAVSIRVLQRVSFWWPPGMRYSVFRRAEGLGQLVRHVINSSIAQLFDSHIQFAHFANCCSDQRHQKNFFVDLRKVLCKRVDFCKNIHYTIIVFWVSVGFRALCFNVNGTLALNHDIRILDFGMEVFPWPHETGNIRNRIRRKYHKKYPRL